MQLTEMTEPDGRKRRALATRRKILEGASRVFLEQGYAGASMHAMAKEAGVTQSLLHHHFGSKEGLWAAVREAGFETVLRELKPIVSDAARGPRFPVALFRAYFDYLREHPDYVRLLGWSYAGAAGGEEVRSGQAAQAVAVIRSYQSTGLIRETVAPESVLVAVWVLAEGWFLGKAEYRGRIGAETLDDAGYREAVSGMLEAGLLTEETP